jgi:hypothetical protein
LLLVLTLAALSAEIDWTRKGYFVVTAPDGTYVSRHVNEIEAAMSAANHAFNSGNTGQLVYRIDSPYFEVSLVVPEVREKEPESAPEPPVDTGEELDPNTVFVCDGGEAGTTIEPTGKDSATGGLIDGLPDPVLTLAKAEQLLNAGSAGTDLRLCEGGVWEDQTLTVNQSGTGVGDYQAQTVVGCYKILNGVPRPCMDTYPICKNGIKTKCLDPVDFSFQSSAR